MKRFIFILTGSFFGSCLALGVVRGMEYAYNELNYKRWYS